MNVKMKRAFGVFILTFLTVVGAQAQCTGWNWPEDKVTAEEKNVLYSDAVRNSNFKAAVAPHRWLLQNAPDLNTSIYINGAKIFQGLIETEKNEAKKKEWIDSLMMIYDMRMQYCNEKSDVMNRKAYDAYRYTVTDKDNLPDLLKLYDETFELNGNNVDYFVTLPYMSVVYYNAKIHKNLTEEEILNRYDKLMGIIDYQIKQGKNVDRLQDYKQKIDGLLVEIVNVDCEFVKKNMAPQFEANPDDLDIAKKIFGFMLAGKCTDDPLWLEAAKRIQEKEPEYGLAKNIALKCLASGDKDCADKYLAQAMELTEDPQNKADLYMTMAKMQEDKGSFSGAREMYYKALSVDPSKTEAYRGIGMLYFNSFNTCKGEKDPVKDRAVFMAAYDMFQKAGESRLMQSAKEQFPSKDEIFTYNYTKGQSINTGCWIGESTVIRTRD